MLPLFCISDKSPHTTYGREDTFILVCDLIGNDREGRRGCWGGLAACASGILGTAYYISVDQEPERHLVESGNTHKSLPQ